MKRNLRNAGFNISHDGIFSKVDVQKFSFYQHSKVTQDCCFNGKIFFIFYINLMTNRTCLTCLEQQKWHSFIRNQKRATFLSKLFLRVWGWEVRPQSFRFPSTLVNMAPLSIHNKCVRDTWTCWSSYRAMVHILQGHWEFSALLFCFLLGSRLLLLHLGMIKEPCPYFVCGIILYMKQKIIALAYLKEKCSV